MFDTSMYVYGLSIREWAILFGYYQEDYVSLDRSLNLWIEYRKKYNTKPGYIEGFDNVREIRYSAAYDLIHDAINSIEYGIRIEKS